MILFVHPGSGSWFSPIPDGVYEAPDSGSGFATHLMYNTRYYFQAPISISRLWLVSSLTRSLLSPAVTTARLSSGTLNQVRVLFLTESPATAWTVFFGVPPCKAWPFLFKRFEAMGMRVKNVNNQKLNLDCKNRISSAFVYRIMCMLHCSITSSFFCINHTVLLLCFLSDSQLQNCIEFLRFGLFFCNWFKVLQCFFRRKENRKCIFSSLHTVQYEAMGGGEGCEKNFW